MSSHRVAVVQAASRLFDLAETLRRFESLLAQPTVERAELVVFPEAFICYGNWKRVHDWRRWVKGARSLGEARGSGRRPADERHQCRSRRRPRTD